MDMRSTRAARSKRKAIRATGRGDNEHYHHTYYRKHNPHPLSWLFTLVILAFKNNEEKRKEKHF
jgi:hypothetical protein